MCSQQAEMSLFDAKRLRIICLSHLKCLPLQPLNITKEENENIEQHT